MTVPKIKHFPNEGFNSNLLDCSDITKVYFSGLYERTVTLSDGTVRTYKAYVPTTATYGDDSTYVAVPDGVDTAEFLTKSGWLEEAEKEENAFILFAFEPVNQLWGDPETETEYVEKAWADMNSKSGKGFRNLVFTNDFNWRWAGYGKGGEMISRYALQNPMMFASLAVVDCGDNIASETFEKCGKFAYTNGKGHTYSEWPNSKIPVPVWFMGNIGENAVNYWKIANDCKGDALELSDGKLYLQDPLSSNLMTFDQKVGQVKVTTNTAPYTDHALTVKILKFIYSFARCGMGSPYSNMLYNTVPDSHFQRETMTIDGMEREWYINVPESYDPETPMPMVIYFHGGGQTGLIGMRQGDWWKYGNQKGFITVCPTGSLGEPSDGKIASIGWKCGLVTKKGESPLTGVFTNRAWIRDPDGAGLEIRFVRALVETICGEYNIDRSRIYATGQSNGGIMTQMMLETCGDIFAAGVTTGGATMVAHTESGNFILNGQFDIAPANITPEMEIDLEVSNQSFREELERKGIAFESSGFYRNGIFNNLVWQNADGVPVLRFCSVTGQAHSWRQNESHMFWDEWLCHYSRDLETGKILYMGK